MSIYIETERLYIRELQEEDAPGMFEMDSDPEVHRYVGRQPLKAIEETQAVIRNLQQQYIDNGIGRWAVIEKQTNNFLGWTGFKLMKETVNGYTNYYDFGYRHSRHAWGRGIATEAGRAALRYGIDTLGLKDVYAMTDVNNLASRNVLEKLGFRFVKIFEYNGLLSWRTADDRMATWYELGE